MLQELKTHRLFRTLLEGGERVAWGAKTITSGGYHALPNAFHAPGLLLAGESAGLVNIPRLKGVHYAIESGILAAEAAVAALQPGEAHTRAGALAPYDRAPRQLPDEGAARSAPTCARPSTRGSSWVAGWPAR